MVFPDLWSMSMMLNESFREQAGIALLTSSDTQVKKNKLLKINNPFLFCGFKILSV